MTCRASFYHGNGVDMQCRLTVPHSLHDDGLGHQWRTDVAVSDDKIDHPAHYGGDTVYEAIKVIDAWGYGVEFCLGSVLKYVSRAGKKPGESNVNDLRKAAWYLEHAIRLLEGQAL